MQMSKNVNNDVSMNPPMLKYRHLKTPSGAKKRSPLYSTINRAIFKYLSSNYSRFHLKIPSGAKGFKRRQLPLVLNLNVYQSSLAFSPVVPVVDLSLGISISSDFDLPILLIGSLSGFSSTPTTSSTSSMSSLKKKMFNTLLEATKLNSPKYARKKMFSCSSYEFKCVSSQINLFFNSFYSLKLR